MNVDNIIFSFSKEGEAIVLDGKLFGIWAYSGIEASDYDIKTRQHIQHDGDALLSKRTLAREIMVEFEYTLWEGKGDMRQKLISFFSNESQGRLTVEVYGTARAIDYEVKSFKVKTQNIFDRLRCLLYVQCLNPYFQSTELACEQISTLVGGWKWKFKLPFRMKQYGPLEKTLLNNGHMQTPVEVYFRGPVAKPKVTNHRTGQYIRLKRDLAADETLYINTEYGNKTVEIRTGEGRIEDGWGYLDMESEFFWLQKGENLIGYSGEDESVRSRGVEVRYRELFYGV